MPKGQYDRKARQVVSSSTDTDRKLPDAPVVTVQSLNFPSGVRELPQDFRDKPSDVEVAQIASMLVPPNLTIPDAPPGSLTIVNEPFPEPPAPAPAAVSPAFVEPAPVRPATYEDWMEEDAPVAPTNDLVTRMVSGWAGTVCQIAHQVAWLPANDGACLEVILTTEHGASVLKANAGAWTEADISAALGRMREELGA